MRTSPGRHPPELIVRALVDPANYGSSREFRTARAAAWAALPEGGRITLTDIANAVGLSRERVRQVLRAEGHSVREGMRGREASTDPVAVVRALRDPKCQSMSALARIAGCKARPAREALQELGLWPTAQRLWRMRIRNRADSRDANARSSIVRALKEFADRTGQVPSMTDVVEGRLPFAHTTAVRYFGSWGKAVAAAGLRPRARGARGHRR